MYGKEVRPYTRLHDVRRPVREGEMMDMTRRRFLQYGAGAGAALALPWASAYTAGDAPRRAASWRSTSSRCRCPARGSWSRRRAAPNEYSFTQREIARQLHPDLPPTPLWAYDDGSGLGGPGGLVRDGGGRAERHAARGRLHAPAAGDVPELDPGRHAADAARQRGAADDPPARRLRRRRQRRQPGGDAERLRPRRDADASSTRTSCRRCRPRCSGSTTTASARRG